LEQEREDVNPKLFQDIYEQLLRNLNLLQDKMNDRGN
jgi:hypothetical protein